MSAEEEISTKRSFAWSGTFQAIEDLAGKICKIIEANPQKKMGFIKYEETEEINKVKTTIEGEWGIEGNIEVLQVLREASQTMSFAKKKVEALLIKIDEKMKNGNRWKNDEEFDEWKHVMWLRIKNICHVVRKAETRSNPPKWIEILPWISGTKGEPEDGAEGAEGGKVEVEDEYGFVRAKAAGAAKVEDGAGAGEEQDGQAKYYDHQVVDVKFSTELMVPMMRKIIPDKKNSDKMNRGPWETGLLKIEGLKDDDVPIGIWPDGWEAKLTGWTVKKIKDLSRGGKAQKDLGTFFKIQHESTKNLLVVDQRTDRALLMSLYEQGKQICQVRVDKFGDLDQKSPSKLPNDHPVVKKAGDFMKEICEAYCKDEVAIEDLYKHRDLKLSQMKINELPKREMDEEGGQPKKKAKQESQEAQPKKKSKQSSKGSSKGCATGSSKGSSNSKVGKDAGKDGNEGGKVRGEGDAGDGKKSTQNARKDHQGIGEVGGEGVSEAGDLDRWEDLLASFEDDGVPKPPAVDSLEDIEMKMAN